MRIGTQIETKNRKAGQLHKQRTSSTYAIIRNSTASKLSNAGNHSHRKKSGTVPLRLRFATHTRPGSENVIGTIYAFTVFPFLLQQFENKAAGSANNSNMKMKSAPQGTAGQFRFTSLRYTDPPLRYRRMGETGKMAILLRGRQHTGRVKRHADSPGHKIALLVYQFSPGLL